MFPCQGTYQAWAIYDSIGFQERFGSSGHFRELAEVAEIRCHSEATTFEVSANDIEYNRANLRVLKIEAEATIRSEGIFKRLFNWLKSLGAIH
jgi:hypothetical protein